MPGVGNNCTRQFSVGLIRERWGKGDTGKVEFQRPREVALLRLGSSHTGTCSP